MFICRALSVGRRLLSAWWLCRFFRTTSLHSAHHPPFPPLALFIGGLRFLKNRRGGDQHIIVKMGVGYSILIFLLFWIKSQSGVAYKSIFYIKKHVTLFFSHLKMNK